MTTDIQHGTTEARGEPAARNRSVGLGDAARAAVSDLLDNCAPALLRSVLDSSPDCIKLLELDGSLLYMNRNGQCAMEVDRFDVIAGSKWPDLWPEDSQSRVADSVVAAREGRATRFEAFCPTAKGSPRWWDVTVSPVLDSDGRPERILSVSRDISERAEREQQIARHERELQDLALAQARTLEEKERLLADKTLLMQEVDHRVKNSLAMITSLLSVQGRMVGNEAAREALRRAGLRVQTIASVHERLYKSKADGQLDLTEYLRGLVHDLCAALGGKSIDIVGDFAPMGEETGERAVTIGLIVTELITNATRHAAPKDGCCTIKVRGYGKPGGRRELIIEDDGCGLPDGFDPRQTQGLGMRVVTGGVDRLGGEFSFEDPDGVGTRFVVRF